MKRVRVINTENKKEFETDLTNVINHGGEILTAKIDRVDVTQVDEHYKTIMVIYSAVVEELVRRED